MAPFKYLSALGLALLLTACGGGGAESDAPASGGAADTAPRALLASEEALARYLASAQLPHGAYDWRQAADLPLDLTAPGYQNVTGVTALGLFSVHDFDMSDGVLDQAPYLHLTLRKSKDYLLQVMDDLNQDNGVTWVSLPNFIFIAEFRARFGLEDSEWTTARDAFDKVLALNDQADGFDATVISDGIWGRILRQRVSLPGIKGWDLAFLYKALVAMESDPFEIDWVYAKLTELSLEMLALEPSEAWVTSSLAHLCEVFARNADERPEALALRDALLALAEDEGSYGDAQTTAYACLALHASGLTTELAAAQAWLREQIDAQGRIVDDAGDVYFEIQGECLQALLR